MTCQSIIHFAFVITGMMPAGRMSECTPSSKATDIGKHGSPQWFRDLCLVLRMGKVTHGVAALQHLRKTKLTVITGLCDSTATDIDCPYQGRCSQGNIVPNRCLWQRRQCVHVEQHALDKAMAVTLCARWPTRKVIDAGGVLRGRIKMAFHPCLCTQPMLSPLRSRYRSRQKHHYPILGVLGCVAIRRVPKIGVAFQPAMEFFNRSPVVHVHDECSHGYYAALGSIDSPLIDGRRPRRASLCRQVCRPAKTFYELRDRRFLGQGHGIGNRPKEAVLEQFRGLRRCSVLKDDVAHTGTLPSSIRRR